MKKVSFILFFVWLLVSPLTFGGMFVMYFASDFHLSDFTVALLFLVYSVIWVVVFEIFIKRKNGSI